MCNKIERIQKKSFKWILNEEAISYSNKSLYFRKCKELKILPMALRFDLCDLVMLHKIIHRNMPINLPTYLTFFTGNSRLRFCHLDTMSLVSSVVPTGSNNALTNSFFYRSHLLWNKLPIEIRNINSSISFKSSLKKHLFESMSVSLSDCTDESESEL